MNGEQELWLIGVTVGISVVGYFVSRNDAEIKSLRKRMHEVENSYAALSVWYDLMKKKLFNGQK